MADLLAAFYLGWYGAAVWGLLQGAHEYAANAGRTRTAQVAWTLVVSLAWPVWVGVEALGLLAGEWWDERDIEGRDIEGRPWEWWDGRDTEGRPSRGPGSCCDAFPAAPRVFCQRSKDHPEKHRATIAGDWHVEWWEG